MGLEYLQAQETVLRALCREAKYIRKTNIAGRTEDYNYDFKYSFNSHITMFILLSSQI